MKNLKPSELPIDTVIGKFAWGQYEELYIKKQSLELVLYWEDLFSGCGCCTDHERISDAGCTKDEKYYSRGGMTTTKTSDEYFEDYKVIALPPGYSIDEEHLHGEWDDDSGTHNDGTGAHICGGVNCEA